MFPFTAKITATLPQNTFNSVTKFGMCRFMLNIFGKVKITNYFSLAQVKGNIYRKLEFKWLKNYVHLCTKEFAFENVFCYYPLIKCITNFCTNHTEVFK